MIREPTACPHRGESDAERVACILAGQIVGRPVAVNHQACAYCCRRDVPTEAAPGPVIASFVRMAARETGDVGLHDRMRPFIEKASEVFPAAARTSHCRHFGAFVRAGECPRCNVHDCTLLGVDVTIKDDCESCPHREPPA